MRPRVRPHLKPHARIVKRYLSSLYSSDVYIGADFEMTMGDWVRVDGRWVQPEVESPCRFCHPTENAEDWSLKPGYIYDGSICVQAPSAETWQETATLAGASLSVPYIAFHALSLGVAPSPATLCRLDVHCVRCRLDASWWRSGLQEEDLQP